MSGLTGILLVLAACFGFLNARKMSALRANGANVQASAGGQTQPRANAPPARPSAKTTEAEDRAAKAEAALAQVQREKADLQGKLDTSQQEIAALRQRAAEANESVPATASEPTGNAQTAELQSQLDDLRRQVDGAEKEKALLAEKLQEAQERAAQPKEAAAKSEPRKRRETATAQRESVSSHRLGVHGTVLAYNQAYNFVVLNLGARNGVEPNSEMLVLRDGTLIGKIRISSVEPATAIGDIITNSLARGVQVQPGDSVIYAGTSP
jgi:hypothetical protein